MKTIPIKRDDARLEHLYGGQKPWWDSAEQRMVTSHTLYIPFGCPDWGELGGVRNEMCKFCGLPGAVDKFRQGFYDGAQVPEGDHLALFVATLEGVARVEKFHTLMIFNGGSFTAMPFGTQLGILAIVLKYPFIRRVVIESRAKFLTESILTPLVEILADHGKALTVRVGVETKNDELRNNVLKKGHSRNALLQGSRVMRKLKVTSGGYALLNPAPNLEQVWALEEAVETLEWILGVDGLHMDEAYLGPTCVSPNTLLAAAWDEGVFNPPSLHAVRGVLERTIPKYPGRIHLLSFKDEPSFVAVPSNSSPRGIPESLLGASDEDLLYHAAFDRYRETMDFGAITGIPRG